MPHIDSWGDLVHFISGSWFAFKSALEGLTGHHDSVLHLIAGAILQVVFAALLRVSPGSLRPWLLVFALEAINELNDMFQSSAGQEGTLSDMLSDAAMTMIVPTLAVVASRLVRGHKRGRFADRLSERAEETEE